MYKQSSPSCRYLVLLSIPGIKCFLSCLTVRLLVFQVLGCFFSLLPMGALVVLSI